MTRLKKCGSNKFLCGFILTLLLSCTDDSALDNLLGISAEAPMYTGYKVISSKQIDFSFSTDVNVKYARFEPAVEIAETRGGKSISIIMAEERVGGEKLTADILVEDKDGNSLNLLIPFRTRNNRVPKVVINEIRTEYSKPRAEFIEIKTKTAGNLGAIRLFAVSSDNKEPVYEFPPVEVAANEYIILHLRTISTDTAIDETGTNLALAISGNRSDTPSDARDLWAASNKKLLHKTDVVYLMDQDDKILDGIAFCEDEKAWAKNKSFEKAAELLAEQKQWLSKEGISIKTPEAKDVFKSLGITLTRTLCRDETKQDSNTSADWYIAASSKNTPGKQNSPDSYN
jgi:hypothetical protein